MCQSCPAITGWFEKRILYKQIFNCHFSNCVFHIEESVIFSMTIKAKLNIKYIHCVNFKKNLLFKTTDKHVFQFSYCWA